MKIQILPCDKILPNNGQILGVPANPRTWEEEDVAALAESIRETPEMMQARPAIVYPAGGGGG